MFTEYCMKLIKKETKQKHLIFSEIPSVLQTSAHTHKHTHTPTPTQIHTRPHKHTHIYIHTHTHTHWPEARGALSGFSWPLESTGAGGQRSKMIELSPRRREVGGKRRRRKTSVGHQGGWRRNKQRGRFWRENRDRSGKSPLTDRR